MNSKYLLLTFYFFSKLLFCSNISPYPELEIDKPQKFKKDDLNENNTLYAFSKNSVTGVYVYDIDSPVPLTFGYATSDNKDTLPASFDSHHNENITLWKTAQGYNYFFSFSISMSNNDKYTFIKIACANSSICLGGDNNLNVKLVANYTWKIILFVIFYFLILNAAIVVTCYFGRKCLGVCCNIKNKQELDLEV